MEPAPPKASVPSVGREVELKLQLEPADLASLRRHGRGRAHAVAPARTERLHSVYFDTHDLELLRQGVTLRVRRGSGGRYVQTLKLAANGGGAGLLARTELESTLDGADPDAAKIPQAKLRARVERAMSAPDFGPILETEMQRTERRLRIDETELLFDLDVGEIRTPRGNLPICELELELVSGDPYPLYVLAAELQQSVRLRISTRSKFERGLERLTGAHPPAQRARSLKLPADATLEQVMLQSFGACLDQILANEEPARRGVDPEGVHQMRVGVRRLRSALTLFRDVLPPDQVRSLRERLRWLADELGAARDLDVFVEDGLSGLRRRFSDDPQLKRLCDEAAQLRAEAHDRVRGCLDSLRYAELTLHLGRWLAGREWRQQPTTPASAKLFLPARTVARELLGRRYRKLRRRGRRAAGGGVQELHALRIETKKLRFAAGFLRSAFPGAHSGRFLRRLARLQDSLGHLNDAATARSLLASLTERLGPADDPEILRCAGFVEGWISRAAEEELSRLPRRWKAVCAQRVFWKHGRRKASNSGED